MSVTKLCSLSVGILIATAIALEVFGPVGTLPAHFEAPQTHAHLSVIDGDTLRTADGERIRLIGIDAPELPPRAACEREAQLALAAKGRLENLIKGATRVEVLARPAERDRDRFDRLLRDVSIDGADAGDILVAEGLAKVWQGRKSAWC